MASELAVAIALAYEDTQPVAKFQLAAIDAQLQEVRDVLDQCIRRIEQLNESAPELGSDPTVERARALFQKLMVKEGRTK